MANKKKFLSYAPFCVKDNTMRCWTVLKRFSRGSCHYVLYDLCGVSHGRRMDVSFNQLCIYFIGWRYWMAALVFCYHKLEQCIWKGDIGADDVFHLWWFILVYCIGIPEWASSTFRLLVQLWPTFRFLVQLCCIVGAVKWTESRWLWSQACFFNILLFLLRRVSYAHSLCW